MFVEKRAAVEKNTIYVKNSKKQNELVAVDRTVTLPEVTYVTAEIMANGPIEIPLSSRIENMEMTISKDGMDDNLTKLTAPGVKDIEIRWAQNVVKSDGSVTQEGCKAFLKAMPKVIMPGASVEAGAATENDITFTVRRYQLFVAGKELLLVDKFTGELKVNGVNYSSKIDSLL